MTRYWFGDQPADMVLSPGDLHQLPDEQIGHTAILYPGARLWAYDHVSGDRVTDLLDGTGNPVLEITTTSYGRIPKFRGPDSVTTLLLGQAEDYWTGVDEPPHLGRWTLTSLDWPTLVSGLDTRVAALEDGGTGDPGEVIATAHPMIWTHPDTVTEDRVSAHPYWNDEGRSQTITSVRAQATVTSGQLAVTVYTEDPDTGVRSEVATLTVDTTTGRAVAPVSAPVSAGTGVTVGVVRGTEADEVADVTVQVMIR